MSIPPGFPSPESGPENDRPHDREFLRTQVLPVATVLVVLLLFWRIWIMTNQRAEDRFPVNCAIDAGPCVRTIANRRVILDIHPRPVTAMTDLIFSVAVESADGEPTSTATPVIDLDMPAMNMGYNRVICETAGQGRYEGAGVIPRCPSGLSTWAATVRIPGLGETEFLFDVAYR